MRLIAPGGGSGSSVVAELAEGVGELAAELLVLVGEFAVAVQCDVQALAQGVVAGALRVGYRGGAVLLARNRRISSLMSVWE